MSRIHKFFCQISLLLWCANVLTAHAMEALHLSGGIDQIALSDRIEALVDQDGRLSLEEVLRPANAGRFLPISKQHINPQAGEVVWLRVTLRNIDSKTATWWLDTGLIECMTIELFAPVPDAGGGYHRQSASVALPFDARPLPLKTFAFPLRLQPAADTIVYLRERVGLAPALQYPPEIRNPSAVAYQSKMERHLWLAYVGAVMALIIFNVLLAIILRDCHYALFGLASLAMMWCVSSWLGGYGAAFELLWPNYPAFERFGHDSAGVAAIVTSAIYVSSLLSLRTQAPRIHSVLMTTATLYVLCWATFHAVMVQAGTAPGGVAANIVHVVGPFYNLTAALTMLLTGIAIVLLSWRGSRPARFLAIATAPIVSAGISANLMTSLKHPLPAHVLMWATLFQMLMMSLGLADRFRQDREEKLRAQGALVAGLQASEKAMEGKVVERTQALSEALTQQQIVMARNVDLVNQLTVQKDLAEAAVLAKSRFVAAASHDLRQPTHALALFIATLQAMGQRPDVKGADVTHIAQRLEIALSGLEQLLNGLLDVSRLDAGAVEVSRQAVSLRNELTSIANVFSGPANAKGLRLDVCLPADLSIDTDPVLLHQILSNLVANAVRYTVRGRVLIGCRRRGSSVEVQVFDTGIGIAPTEREKIFEEFYQVNNYGRTHDLGLGLGLAIVRRSANLLGAALNVESSIGKGSMFSLTLPRATSNRHTHEVKSVDAQPGAARAVTVLVIDDDPLVRDAAEILLSNWGHKVFAAANAQEATASAKALESTSDTDGEAQKIDLILSDYRLAENSNGADAIRAVCECIGRKVPAIIITGDTSPDRISEARASGYRLLHKPLDPHILLEVMTQIEASLL